ncbi:hypothetical protein C8R43DRAFT_1193367 [Mycena crocata]|nr:hypothetical protein C8R43DRAFT_1193367 [Mycena crocata]
MLEGSSNHENSAGHKGTVQAGGVQWMVAGRGIMHAEMPVHAEGQPDPRGLQFWVNLPKKFKMVEPTYQELGPSLLRSRKALMALSSNSLNAIVLRRRPPSLDYAISDTWVPSLSSNVLWLTFDPVPSLSVVPTDVPPTPIPDPSAGTVTSGSTPASGPETSSITLFSKHTKFSIADVNVLVVGGFLLSIVISIPFIMRRRRRAKASQRGRIFINVSAPGSQDRRNRRSKPTWPRTPMTPRSPHSPRAQDKYSSGAPTESQATTTMGEVTRLAASGSRWN